MTTGTSHPGRNLSCRAAVASLESLFHCGQEFVDGLHPVERRADLDRVARLAQEFVKRLALAAGVEVPPGGIQGGLGKTVAADCGQLLLKILARRNVLPDQPWSEPVTHAGEHAGGPFRAGQRSIARTGFPPADNVPGPYAHEHGFQGLEFTTGGRLRLPERQGDVEDFEGVDVHGGGLGDRG